MSEETSQQESQCQQLKDDEEHLEEETKSDNLQDTTPAATESSPLLSASTSTPSALLSPCLSPIIPDSPSRNTPPKSSHRGKRQRTRTPQPVNTDSSTPKSNKLKPFEAVGLLETIDVKISHNDLKSLPNILYAPSISTQRQIQFAAANSAPQIAILPPECLEIFNKDGYRTARTNYGIHTTGSWFYELTMHESGSAQTSPHVRFGWATAASELQAPVGFDAFGFCLRNLDGKVFHQGYGKLHGEGWGVGDVVGTLLNYDPDPLKRFIAFFKNGRLLGSTPPFITSHIPATPTPAHATSISTPQKRIPIEIKDGIYYPAVALYMGAHVILNPGPTFSSNPVVQKGSWLDQLCQERGITFELQPISALVPPLPPPAPPAPLKPFGYEIGLDSFSPSPSTSSSQSTSPKPASETITASATCEDDSTSLNR